MILIEERNSVSVAYVGLISLAGRARRSHSISFGGSLPVSAGICLVWLDAVQTRFCLRL